MLAAPSAPTLITTFSVGRSRNTAMGVYATGGVGATVGLLLGGTLTDALDRRWVFFVNIPIGLAVLAGTRSLVEAEGRRGPQRHPTRPNAAPAASTCPAPSPARSDAAHRTTS
ncbi:MFS transporter [Streptomyces sp. NBC_01235]|uniref:MFS transporter n=1 Tax=Streptomyces sp. NBC_01235 TaxID=2903788 RepID=UPI002E101816|nr:hypothetical protein OG289_27060 [Streptomyces sp. NBC_01235]